MEYENYWVYNNKIIFKPKFNEPIKNYIEDISKCNDLIFSNHNLTESILKTNKIYDEIFTGSQFNQNIILHKSIQNLSCGYKFNKKYYHFNYSKKIRFWE